MWFEGIAYAQAAAKGASTSEQALLSAAPLLFVIAIFYFVLFQPQLKKGKELQKMLAALKRNDEVVTTGGLIGRIVELSEKLVVLEIASNVRVRVERAQIAALSPYSKAAAKTGAKD